MNFTRRDLATDRRVNALLANALAPLLKPSDLVWVHDYHLIPMADELRRAGAKQRIGFFLHTPFPPLGVLATLPHCDDLLKSLCAYDLVGFQTMEDLTAFHNAISRRAGGKISTDGYVHAFDRVLRAGAFPIGIDTEAIAEMASGAVKSRTARRLQESLRGRQLIIGVDRLDYRKGSSTGSKHSPAFSTPVPRTATMSACCRSPPRRAARFLNIVSCGRGSARWWEMWPDALRSSIGRQSSI
jgi:trehalose 6-phosphate synthase